MRLFPFIFFFFFNDTATTEIYTLSLHDALPISLALLCANQLCYPPANAGWNGKPSDRTIPLFRQILAGLPTSASGVARSEEHTSELQSHLNLVCRLLLEKKKKMI